MDFKESYILYKDGELYGSPFSSKKTLDECLKILKRLEPSSSFLVEVFVSTFDRSFYVPSATEEIFI